MRRQARRVSDQTPEQRLAHAEEMLRALEERKAVFDANLQLNECPGCGAYRLDGRPPCIHATGCEWAKNAPMGYLSDGTPI